MKGSGHRYSVRSARWQATGLRGWWYRHQAWWLLHNALSHPLLGVLPCVWTVWFHDWTAWGLNRYDELRGSHMPVIPSYGRWVWHNVFGHLAICVPVAWSFQFHDRGSKGMGVKGWL